MITAGIDERIGPSTGISSPMPEMSARTEKYGIPMSQSTSPALTPMMPPISS